MLNLIVIYTVLNFIHAHGSCPYNIHAACEVQEMCTPLGTLNAVNVCLMSVSKHSVFLVEFLSSIDSDKVAFLVIFNYGLKANHIYKLNMFVLFVARAHY